MDITGPSSTIRKARKLRRALTLPEVLLWQQLRRRPGGLKFRRQHPAGRYVLDFYIDAVRMAIEVDGEVHGRGDGPARDAERDHWLAGRGVRTLRVTAAAVLTDLDAVVRYIVTVARDAPSTSFAGPPPPAGED